MGRGIMLENFERVNLEWIRDNIDYSTNSFTDPNGIYIVETDMPEDVAYTHNIEIFGTPRRISAYNPADSRKFKVNLETFKILHDEAGEQGFIGYLDFYKEEKDGSINSNVGIMYLYPDYRGKGISREMTDYLEIITPAGSILNVGNAGDSNIFYMAKQWNDLHPGRVKYE
jgi:GNAT superfamily N-acetyltransferase